MDPLDIFRLSQSSVLVVVPLYRYTTVRHHCLERSRVPAVINLTHTALFTPNHLRSRSRCTCRPGIGSFAFLPPMISRHDHEDESIAIELRVIAIVCKCRCLGGKPPVFFLFLLRGQYAKVTSDTFLKGNKGHGNPEGTNKCKKFSCNFLNPQQIKGYTHIYI